MLPGETCDVPGVGTVPVAAVRDALGSAFAAIVISDGHDVVHVAHAGRRADAWQRTALEWRFDECATQGCHNTARREVDHSHDWADTHYTFLPTLRVPCKACHRRRSVDGHAYVGEPDAAGKYRLVPPGHAEHPDTSGADPPTPASIRPIRSRGPTSGVGGDRPVGPTPAPDQLAVGA